MCFLHTARSCWGANSPLRRCPSFSHYSELRFLVCIARVIRYLSPEFPTTPPHPSSSRGNAYAGGVTLLETVQLLVSAPKELKVNQTLCSPEPVIRDCILGTEGAFKILHLTLCKNAFWKEKRIITIDKKPSHMPRFTPSSSLSKRMALPFKVTRGRF